MGQSALDEIEIRAVSARHRLGVSVLIIFLLGATCVWPSQAQGGASLGPIEKKLFFKTYDGESDEGRLSRIENNLFGQTMQGSFQDRMNRINEAAAPQTNPDGSVSGMGTHESQGTTSSAPSAADLKRQAEEDRQAAIERAKVAVQAAKEEQTNKLLETGVSLWRSKRGSEALQYFEQALKVDPHNPSALYYAGIVYESKKNYVEALASYRKAADEDPRNQEYADAVTAVQKLMNSRPVVDPKQREISLLATEAGDAYKRGEYLSALDLYKQLDQKAPNQALVKYNLGMLYLQAKHYHDALEQFELAVKLRPSDQKFQQAYQQLKANIDKSEAEQKQSEAAWAGNPAMNGGAALAPNNMPNHPYGHSAMNVAAQQNLPHNMQNYAVQNPGNSGMSGNSGMQASGMQGGMQGIQNGGMSNNGIQNSLQNNNGMQKSAPTKTQPVASRPVATPPGTGREPGLAPADNGASSLKNWAQVQNSSRAEMSDIPPGQHPLVRHPLHSSAKPATTLASGASPSSSLPEKPLNFNKLEQPTGNAMTALGIEAANTKSGVAITHVGIASRASKAGLLKGDLIRAVDNKVVTSLSQIISIVSKKGSDAPIDLHIQRKDQMGVVHL